VKHINVYRDKEIIRMSCCTQRSIYYVQWVI